MRILKTKTFARYADPEAIDDACLRQAVDRAELGLVDAGLGGGLIKQRVARSGKGRSGGYRTIVAYCKGHRAVFLFGFAKSDPQDLGPKELRSLRAIGRFWLDTMDADLEKAIGERSLLEVNDDTEA